MKDRCRWSEGEHEVNKSKSEGQKRRECDFPAQLLKSAFNLFLYQMKSC